MTLQREMELQGNFLFKKRSYLPLVVLAIGLGVYTYTKITDPTASQLPVSEAIYEYICLGVCLLGLAIRIYTVGHTPHNTSGRNTSKGQVADVLNTLGIYSVVRHPLYVGNFFMWLGIAMLPQNFWFATAFVFMYWVYYERIMHAEEQFLQRKFGEIYTDWAGRTPAFIPKMQLLSATDLSFSWRKVLTKEKNGVLAIFILIFGFRILGQSIVAKAFVFPIDFWAYGTLASVLGYVLAKVLSKLGV